ncbi:MAG TPA: Lrp/AsnC ligand binding domain-containing protein [Actinomycetota bacterium]
MEGYVLIQTMQGEPIAQVLRAIPGVVLAEDLTGAYDAMALVRADSTRDLIDETVAEIRRLPGVTRALPAPVVRSLSRVRDAEPAMAGEAA